ncbi:lysophospholipid acyltransferase family protein [Noviherbaspirillum sedimenti]|uniref:1-acyl-sn-glycerol-3-phosphate acyltransferase n=1 Tax=Noviherbaspirillum sedimenti TaxID=2320865 RepID=A0A3A3G806_9BURK|nr:lysophospholipid acyltransferase family protein [Noviherbaspirillum sedimenti]RJG03765.1 1-acyl-sn-glycerol-3-phosphate acyltransferase [Noviherbaspirillum sedimenti]
MTALRLARICLHLLAGLLTCALVFPFAGETGRARCIRRWSVKLLGLCQVEVELIDAAVGATPSHALIVANHISWLDIFVINSWHPCRFVAKADIRAWPLLGWLCEKSGTIFIERGSLRAVRHIYAGLVHRLRDGERVAFFPEGTTSVQGSVLPFHSNLFESAIEAQVPVQPFALRYLSVEGEPGRFGEASRFHPAVTFIDDMTFVESLLVILKGGRIRAELVRLPLIETAGGHRRDLAQAAQRAIAAEVAAAEGLRAA